MPSEWFENKRTGERLKLVTVPGETGGSSFVLEYVNRPFTGKLAIPPHLHPTADEMFEIISGSARYIVGDKELSAGPGERVLLPAGKVHVHPWSDSSEALHVRQTALASPSDLRGLTASMQAAVTIFGLARAGKVNSKGAPNFLQLALLASTTIPTTYLAGIPHSVQRLTFGTIGRIAKMAGYKTSYPEYVIVTSSGVEVGAAMR
jgi:mannose-6-phosphate isomerase-like protein (cupin superfamily)